MKIMNRTVIAVMLLLATTAVVSAHDYRSYDTRDIDARRANQISRIEEGRRSGQLNWRKYQFLRHEQAQIAPTSGAPRRTATSPLTNGVALTANRMKQAATSTD